MYRLKHGRFAALLLGLALAAPLAAAEPQKQKLYYPLLHSTALIVVLDGSQTFLGTAWVADRERRLLVTNYHVVVNGKADEILGEVRVFFPDYRDGKLIAEQSYYQRHVPQLTQAGRAMTGRVIDASESVDLAIVQVPKLPDDVTAVRLASESVTPGDRLNSIGNPIGSDALWLYTAGAAKQVSFRTWVQPLGSRLLRIKARVVETQAPNNFGDSGGPVVNDDGELVAVTESSLGGNLLNVAIDVSEVRAYLAETDWMTRVHTAADYDRRAHYYFDPDQPHALRHHRLESALADASEAIRLNPNEADYYLDRAMIRAQHLIQPQPELAKARADCDKALELHPRYALAYARRASVAFSQKWSEVYFSGPLFSPGPPKLDLLLTPKWKEYEKQALEDLTEAIKIDPGCIAAYKLLAIHYRLADPARAIPYLDEIVRRQPDDAEALASRAEVYQSQKDYQAALRDLAEAVRLKPDSPRLRLQRALIYTDLKQHEKAVEDREKAAELEPEEPGNWRLLAESYAALHRNGEAILAYSTALKAINDFGISFGKAHEILLARGDIFAAAGNADQAREDYRMALKAQKPPSPEFAEQVQERLKKLP